MLSRKRAWALGLIGVVLASVAALACLLPARDPITPQNLDKIAPGMSASAVEEILGRKPDDKMSVGGVEVWRTWIGRSYTIFVSFSDDGIVASKMSMPVGMGESFLDRILGWIR